MIEKKICLLIAITILAALILLVSTRLYFALLLSFTFLTMANPNEYSITKMILSVMYILAFIVMLIGIFVFHV